MIELQQDHHRNPDIRHTAASSSTKSAASLDTDIDSDHTANQSDSGPNQELTRVKGKFQVLFGVNLIIVGFHVGYVMAYTNQTTDTLDAKFGWEGGSKTLY